TDAWGARAALEELVEVRGARVLLIGAGGAARAVAFGLADAGARVDIVNRSPDKAEALAARVSQEGHRVHSLGGLDALSEATGYDVLVNASSLGMSDYDPKSPVPRGALCEGLVVMDIVYKPIRTALV